ncbi:MAG: hypothetical protein K1X72_09910 [Pyrinomonadaceae bacterium]|nr:hypothetical protein [Pyrinomonadaceae bacterium]
MITGFNTDVEYNGVTYHVQTEDKGLDTPLILSLVYNRGTILASKRSPYNDLLLGKFDEKELSERLNRQHKLICAAIKAGRIEDLKRMNNKQPAANKAVVVDKAIEIQPKAESNGNIAPINPTVSNNLTPIVTNNTPPQKEQSVEFTPIPRFLQEEPQFFEPIKKPSIELPQLNKPVQPIEIIDAPIEITDADLIFDEIENINDTQNLQEVIVIPDEAVEVVTDFFEDEKIDENKLLVQLMNEVEFRSGEAKTVSILVSRGKSENTLIGANVMVKVLGSSFRPLIFHTKTDSSGVAIINLQVPQFSRGRAAVLFKAMVNGDEAEIRRVIQPI